MSNIWRGCNVSLRAKDTFAMQCVDCTKKNLNLWHLCHDVGDDDDDDDDDGDDDDDDDDD